MSFPLYVIVPVFREEQFAPAIGGSTAGLRILYMLLVCLRTSFTAIAGGELFAIARESSGVCRILNARSIV